MKWYVPWIFSIPKDLYSHKLCFTWAYFQQNKVWKSTFSGTCVYVHTVCPINARKTSRNNTNNKSQIIFFPITLESFKDSETVMAQDFAIFGIRTNLGEENVFYMFPKSLRPSWILNKNHRKIPERFGDVFLSDVRHWALFQPTAKHHQKVSHCQGCRLSLCTCGPVTSDTSLWGWCWFFFRQRTNSRCSCDRSFLRCMLPLNQRDLLTESFPLIHVQHDGLGASAWTVSGTEISRPFATPSRGVFVHQPRNPS